VKLTGLVLGEDGNSCSVWALDKRRTPRVCQPRPFGSSAVYVIPELSPQRPALGLWRTQSYRL
jgi:hypothetical protein